MLLSQASRYGLKGLVFLAQQPAGTVVLLGDIASAEDLPRSFLAKIFRRLARHGVVRSSRGAVRGYSLARPPKRIQVRELLEVIEGPDIATRCPFWDQGCTDDNPCVFHEQHRGGAQGVMRAVMEQTLEDLVNGGAASRSGARREGLRKLQRSRKRQFFGK